MSSRKILSVGQCMADHGQIAHLLHSTFGAEVVSRDTARESLELLRQEPFDLVLVNRVFDFDGDSGIDFIRQMNANEQLRKIPVMLVSNYEDAQARAVAAGAQPGFGKASLREPETMELLHSYL
jgi:CheY-like chemotaxis protein